jgi:hypothetical protein
MRFIHIPYSTLRINVKPWAPHANEPILSVKPFSDGVGWEVDRVREADEAKDEGQRIRLFSEDMFDPISELAGRCARLYLPVIGQHVMKSTQAVALDV